MNQKSKLAEPLFVINNPFAPRLSPELAKEIGLNESILFLQIEFWIRLPQQKEHDGKLWTYESVRDFQEAFPFWSIATINRTINRLVELELVFIGNYNQAKYDRTRWFALNPAGICKLKSVKWQGSETASTQNDTGSNQNETPSNQNDTTIPETSPETSSDIIPQAEKNLSAIPPDGNIEFGEPNPRERLSTEQAMQLTAAAIGEFERTGGNPAVADPRVAQTQTTELYVKSFCAILDYHEAPPPEIFKAAGNMVKAQWYKDNRRQVDRRLLAYRNGDGKQFRKPNQNVWFILTQLQRDIASGKGKRKVLEVNN
jgi:hypothetical protein